MRENEEYYQLRPYVRCQTASGEFDVSIHNGGPLDIYYDEKLDEEAANDLSFYLEKKLPYITCVQALQISIYRFTINTDEPEIYWSGNFRNHRAEDQVYKPNHQIEFLL